MDGYQLMFRSRYFYLFIALIAYFVISPLFIGNMFDYVILSLLFSLIVLFGIILIYRHKKLIEFTMVLGILSLIAYLIGNFLEPTRSVYISHFCVNIVFLSIVSYSVIYSVTQEKKITVDTLFGAICGYLLLGLIWTFIYSIIFTANPLAFSDHIMNKSYPQRAQIFIYYSFCTMTTLGLGDIYPISGIARAWTWLESVIGQIYLAVWISQIVGLHIAQKNTHP